MVRRLLQSPLDRTVVEAYRLDRHDNFEALVYASVAVAL